MSRARTSLIAAVAKRSTSVLLVLLAVGGASLIAASRSAGADPNNANCKPNRATCAANNQCCSGACIAGLCATPTPTTTTTTTVTTTSTSTTVLQCTLTDSQCRTACSTDADCPPDRTCDGNCEPKLTLGRACLTHNDCFSDCCCGADAIYPGDPGGCGTPSICGSSGILTGCQCPGVKPCGQDSDCCTNQFCTAGFCYQKQDDGTQCQFSSACAGGCCCATSGASTGVCESDPTSCSAGGGGCLP
jgi:hypothetical protein